MTIILIISILINIFFVVYLRWLLKKLMFLSENILGLLQSLGLFSKHVSSVYGLETFYGDETLQNMLRHTGDMAGWLSEYKHIHSLSEDLEVEEEHDFDDQEDPGEPYRDAPSQEEEKKAY